jgi:hypothetical protein
MRDARAAPIHCDFQRVGDPNNVYRVEVRKQVIS